MGNFSQILYTSLIFGQMPPSTYSVLGRPNLGLNLKKSMISPSECAHTNILHSLRLIICWLYPDVLLLIKHLHHILISYHMFLSLAQLWFLLSLYTNLVDSVLLRWSLWSISIHSITDLFLHTITCLLDSVMGPRIVSCETIKGGFNLPPQRIGAI